MEAEDAPSSAAVPLASAAAGDAPGADAVGVGASSHSQQGRRDPSGSNDAHTTHVLSQPPAGASASEPAEPPQSFAAVDAINVMLKSANLVAQF